MATNEIFKVGANLSAPVPDGTVAGTPLRLGSLNCVAQTDEGGKTTTVNGIPRPTGGIGNADNYASVKCDGVHRVSVDGALTFGQLVYITSDGVLKAEAVTATVNNAIWGKAVQAKATGIGDVNVLIVNGS